MYVTRNVVADGSRYFGPYPNASSVRTIMYLLKKLFPYRSCNKVITGNDARPCLEYYIDRCIAPCTGASTRQEYRAVIEQVVLFLEGKTDAVVKNLRKYMTLAAQRLEFERATSIRDQLRAIENGIKINVGLAKFCPIGVDTMEDYLALKKKLEYNS